MTKVDIDYKETKKALDEILDWFESSDASVDEAMQKYDQAEKLINQLQDYLKDKNAKIKIITKKSKF